MTSFEVLVSNHQLVAGDRVSTRAFKDAPGIFPLRVLYYASPPDLCTDVTMPNCRHKKAAKLSGADDRFEVLVRSVCDSSGGFVKSCGLYLAVSRAIRSFPPDLGKTILSKSCSLSFSFDEFLDLVHSRLVVAKCLDLLVTVRRFVDEPLPVLFCFEHVGVGNAPYLVG